MIDEYDSTFSNPKIPQSIREFQWLKINDILGTLKDHHIIVSGVYHPQTLGFNISGVNNYGHHSLIIDPNALAFTKKEVKEFYFLKILEAVNNLPKKARQELIQTIKRHSRFLGEEKTEILTDKSQASKIIKEDSQPTQKYQEEFNQDKLADYVIDLMFFMHDGFNINYMSVPSKKNLIISPQIVVTVLDRLTKNQQPFFQWSDYTSSAKHYHVRAIFNSKNYCSLKPEAKQFLSMIIKKKEATVPHKSLYPETNQKQLLAPQSILFQEGLLSVAKLYDKNGLRHAQLKIPNYGVKQYLIDLKKDISQIIANLEIGFSGDLEKKKQQQRFYGLRNLFYSINIQVYNFVVDNLGDHRLTEKNYTTYFVEFLKSVKSNHFSHIEIVKELQVDNQQKVENAKKHDQKIRHTDTLEPDITIKNLRTNQWLAIEIYRNPKASMLKAKKNKYYQLQNNYTTVLILAFDNEFKKLLRFDAFTPKRFTSDETS